MCFGVYSIVPAPLPPIARVGVTLILVACGGHPAWLHWAGARIWTPLDMEVSLASGDIRSPEFEINYRSTYEVSFCARKGLGHSPERSDPPYYQYCLPELEASWSLFSHEKMIVQHSGQSCDSLGEFRVGPGHYVLKVHTIRDGSRFDGLQPHLSIKEVGGAQENTATLGDLVFWGFIVFATLGMSAIMAAGIGSRHLTFQPVCPNSALSPPGADSAACEARSSVWAIRFVPRRRIAKEYLLGDLRSSSRRPLTGVSSTALLGALTFLLVFLSLTVLQGMARPILVGLPVRLLPAPSATGRSPGIAPLVVRVSPPGVNSRPRLYVDSRSVSRGDFESVLQKELSQRPPNWPVYLDGDPDMEAHWVLEIVDVIRGLRAEVVLLPGPRARGAQEFRRTPGPRVAREVREGK